MRMIINTLMGLGLSIALIAGAANAKPHLRDVAEIDDGLMWVAIADEMRKRCGDLSPRMIKALVTLRHIKKRAVTLGYSDVEIDAYVDSSAEKKRMRGRGEAYLKSKNVKPSDTVALCKLGHAEIAQSSKIGVLLKAN